MKTEVKTLYLHIGTEKTGTTSLQTFLAENEAALQAQGFTYLCDPAKPYCHKNATTPLSLHAPVVACFFADSQEYIPEEKHFPKDFLLQTLADDLRRNDKNVVLSSEHFSSRLRATDDLESLRQVFTGYNVKIVCYIRRQDEMALASFSTDIKSGRREPFRVEDIHPNDLYYNYAALIEPWSKIFGKENLLIRSYGRLEGNDIRKDFMALLGLRAMDSFAFSELENPSLDASQAEHLRLVNLALPAFQETSLPLYQKLLHLRRKATQCVPKGPPLKKLLSRSQRQQILSRFSASNAALEKEYMRPGDLDDWRDASTGHDVGAELETLVTPLSMAQVLVNALASYMLAPDELESLCAWQETRHEAREQAILSETARLTETERTLREQLAQAQTNAQQLQNDLQACQKELNVLLQSRSWRFTQSLRAASGILRALGRFGPKHFDSKNKGGDACEAAQN